MESGRGFKRQAAIKAAEQAKISRKSATKRVKEDNEEDEYNEDEEEGTESDNEEESTNPLAFPNSPNKYTSPGKTKAGIGRGKGRKTMAMN